MAKGFTILVQKQQINIQVRIQSEKFDNFQYEAEDIQLGFEGVLLNLTQLLNKYAARSIPHLFLILFSKYGISFLQELKGEFCGFIYDKEQDKIYTYTNFTATKRVFYYHNNSIFSADTSLDTLTLTLKENSVPVSLDTRASYTMLTCSNMLEDMTPIQDVKKLRNAESICFDCKKETYTVENYFSYHPLNLYTGSKSQAIDTLHELFNEAVQLEYTKDQESGVSPLALLSGGLDSRVALLYALELGFKPGQVLCFSQKGYWDEKIAGKIASDYNLPFLFVPLNGGEYLMNIDRMTQISEGLVHYTGSMHVDFAYQFIKRENIGLIHGGQLGDAILGSYTQHPYKHPPTTSKIISSFQLYPRLETVFKDITENYDSEEFFLLKNVGFNRVVLGSYVAEEFSYQTSPFMHSPFIKFALSLPEKWKYNQKIYLEWINKHCKPATRYIWERTLMKPNASWKTPLGDQVVKRAYNIITNYILGRPYKGNMTAYEYYYHTNTQIQNYIDQYFQEYIPLLDDTIRKDAESLFKNGTFFEKILVLSLLATAKKYLL